MATFRVNVVAAAGAAVWVVEGAEVEVVGATGLDVDGLEEHEMAEVRTSERITRTDSRIRSFFILFLLYLEYWKFQETSDAIITILALIRCWFLILRARNISGSGTLNGEIQYPSYVISLTMPIH